MWRRSVFFASAVAVLVAREVYNPAARAAATASTPQQLSEQQTPPSRPHRIKIWTNDDLIALRTPEDIYILAKEAKAAAAEEAKALMACFAWNQTEATIEETQKALEDTLQSIRDSEDAVAQVRKQLEDSPENLRARNQKELERRTTELQASREQLSVLQQRLRELTKEPAENPAEPTTVPPQ